MNVCVSWYLELDAYSRFRVVSSYGFDVNYELYGSSELIYKGLEYFLCVGYVFIIVFGSNLLLYYY
jgi:hypothetical protein